MADVKRINDTHVLVHANVYAPVPPGWEDFALQLAAEHALGHIKETAMQRLVALMPGATSAEEMPGVACFF